MYIKLHTSPDKWGDQQKSMCNIKCKQLKKWAKNFVFFVHKKVKWEQK